MTAPDGFAETIAEFLVEVSHQDPQRLRSWLLDSPPAAPRTGRMLVPALVAAYEAGAAHTSASGLRAVYSVMTQEHGIDPLHTDEALRVWANALREDHEPQSTTIGSTRRHPEMPSARGTTASRALRYEDPDLSRLPSLPREGTVASTGIVVCPPPLVQHLVENQVAESLRIDSTDMIPDNAAGTFWSTTFTPPWTHPNLAPRGAGQATPDLTGSFVHHVTLLAAGEQTVVRWALVKPGVRGVLERRQFRTIEKRAKRVVDDHIDYLGRNGPVVWERVIDVDLDALVGIRASEVLAIADGLGFSRRGQRRSKADNVALIAALRAETC